jgi:DNA-binding NtrC family response regulator
MDQIKVILVDDEVEYVTTLSERMRMRGMETHIAFDGEKALEMVKTQSFDVMVLDLKMPGIDGLTVLKSLKKSHPDINIIIITGHGSDDERKKAYEHGAFMYMQKPISLEELTEHIKNACIKNA